MMRKERARMTTIEKAAQRLVDILREQVGYQEKASNANLDDKTSNAGANNWTKFAAYFDDLWNRGIKWYNTRKNGFDWCDIFFDWGQCQAWGYELARKVLYQPMESAGAGCPYSANYYRANGAWIPRSDEPKVGDQIFFGDVGNETHTGAVSKVTSTTVYTIEGNSSNMVVEKSYARTASNIAGYGRPNYSLVAAQFDALPPTIDKDEPITISMSKDELNALVDRRVAKAIEASMGKMIAEIGDIPWEGVRAEMRQILDAEAIDGGTTCDVNPDDIGLPLNLVRVLVGAKRYVEKLIGK